MKRLFRFTWRSRRDIARDVANEFDFHIEERTRELVESGMRPAEAHARALKEFGNVAAGARGCTSIDARTEIRRRAGRSFADLGQDLRYGARLVRRNPGFAVAAISTLAVAIGGNTAVFSLANALLLKPLPVSSPDTLVKMQAGESRIAWANAQDLHERAGVFSDLVLQQGTTVSLQQGALSVRVVGNRVSPNFFTALGVPPQLGRTFSPADGRPDVVVLSERAWRVRFGSDPSIVGRPITLDGRPYEVVGVMPPAFRGIAPPGFARDLWIPVDLRPGTTELTVRDRPQFEAFGRLRPGIVRPAATAAIRTAAVQLAGEHRELPTTFTTVALYPVSGVDGLRGMSGALMPVLAFLALLAIASAFVLLIACANVAGLLLSRAAARRREVAVRLAIGASRGRLIRQLLTESLVLATAGGVAGLGLAAALVRFTNIAIAQLPFPLEFDLSIDYRILAWASGVSTLTALFAGLAPARRAARLELVPALKDEAGDRRSQRFRRGLVVAQIAVCTLLLVWTGLFLRSLTEVNQVDPGFNSEGVLLADIALADDEAAPGVERLIDDLQASAEGWPGVESTGGAWAVPLALMSREDFAVFQETDPHGSRGTRVGANRVTPGWFRTLRIPMRAGRDFTTHDGPDTPPVIVVNQTLATRLWQGDAVGRRLKFYGLRNELITAEIVGVVADSKSWTLGEEPGPMVYLAARQRPSRGLTLFIRTSDVAGAAEAIRHEVARHGERTSVELKPMPDAIAVALMPARAGAILTTGFAAMAILLAVLGVYGLVSFVVTQRTREIAVRMALGATRASVLRLVLLNCGSLTAIGIALGAIVASLSSPLLGGLLVNVGPNDPLGLAAATLLVGLGTLLASAPPALRASRLEPQQVLKVE
jgi:predicted permease